MDSKGSYFAILVLKFSESDKIMFFGVFSKTAQMTCAAIL
jgi:hypothetical protein